MQSEREQTLQRAKRPKTTRTAADEFVDEQAQVSSGCEGSITLHQCHLRDLEEQATQKMNRRLQCF